jgi:histone deacetylase complex regulatory component SIN3
VESSEVSTLSKSKLKNDALSYIDAAKMALDPPRYKTFIEILRSYRAETKSTKEVVEDIKTLFHDNQELVMRFSSFLPESERYRLDLENTEGHDQDGTAVESSEVSTLSKSKPKIQDALSFIDAAKMALDPPRYKTFIEILKSFRAETKSTKEVVEDIKTLFHDNQELVMRFSSFLPESERYRLDLENTEGHDQDGTAVESSEVSTSLQPPSPSHSTSSLNLNQNPSVQSFDSLPYTSQIRFIQQGRQDYEAQLRDIIQAKETEKEKAQDISMRIKGERERVDNTTNDM